MLLRPTLKLGDDRGIAEENAVRHTVRQAPIDFRVSVTPRSPALVDISSALFYLLH